MTIFEPSVIKSQTFVCILFKLSGWEEATQICAVALLLFHKRAKVDTDEHNRRINIQNAKGGHYAHLDLTFWHAQGVCQFGSLRPGQVFGLLKRLLQRKNLVTGKGRSCVLLSSPIARVILSRSISWKNWSWINILSLLKIRPLLDNQKISMKSNTLRWKSSIFYCIQTFRTTSKSTDTAAEIFNSFTFIVDSDDSIHFATVLTNIL